MGPICAQPLQKEQCTTSDSNTKNLIQFQGILGETISINILFNSYRQCKGESLLVVVQSKNLHHCDPLREYTNDTQQTIDLIQNMRKTFFKPALAKHSPYKKLLLCIMPTYRSEDAHAYKQMFLNVLREALQGVKELAAEFMNTIDGVHTLPNQLLIGLMLRELINANSIAKLKLLTTQKKILNMYRYELIKTERFVPQQPKF